MNLVGTWENIVTGALLKFFFLSNAERDYEWHYGFDGTKFNTVERVDVNYSRENQPAFVRSKRFNSCYLYIENEDCIRIDGEILKKLDSNPFKKI